jgi:hypothetical protein
MDSSYSNIEQHPRILVLKMERRSPLLRRDSRLKKVQICSQKTGH